MKEHDKVYSIFFTMHLFLYIVPQYDVYVWGWFLIIEWFCIMTNHLITKGPFKKEILMFGLISNIVHIFMPFTLVTSWNIIIFKTTIFCLALLKIDIVFY